jgi:hypothetical protein
MAFLSFYGKLIKLYHLISGSLFLTVAVISINEIGLNAINVNIKNNTQMLTF